MSFIRSPQVEVVDVTFSNGCLVLLMCRWCVCDLEGNPVAASLVE